MASRTNKQCNVCRLPDDLQDLIYDLLVRQKVKPGPAYTEVAKVLKDRGLNPPNRSSFYTHAKSHLDPERSALMTIARSEDQLSESARGFDNVLFAYLLKKWEEEKGNRQSLQNLIKKIDKQVDSGKLDANDLAKLGGALSYAVKTLQEGNLISLVQNRIIEDLLNGVIFSVEREVAMTLRKTRDTLLLKVKPGEEAKRLIDEALSTIIKACEDACKMAIHQLEILKDYKQ